MATAEHFIRHQVGTDHRLFASGARWRERAAASVLKSTSHSPAA